jgi:ribosomal protein L37AE/L43A
MLLNDLNYFYLYSVVYYTVIGVWGCKYCGMVLGDGAFHQYL